MNGQSLSYEGKTIALPEGFHFKTPPFQFQEEGMVFADGKNFFAIFLEQGMGKTKLIIDIASKLFLEGKIEAVLVVAPNEPSKQFLIEQLPTHSPVPSVGLYYEKGGSKRAERAFEAIVENKAEGVLKYLVTNTEGFSYPTYLPDFRRFLQNQRTMLVIDEAQTIKNVEARRTQNIILGLSTLTKMGRRITKIAPLSAYRAVLTGTPVANSPFDLFSIFEFLSPGFWGMPFSAFKARYGLERTDTVPGTTKQFKRRLSIKEMRLIREASARGLSPDRISRMYGVSFEDINYLLLHPDIHAPYKNLPELKAKIAPYSFIRKKVDCLDLPPKLYEKVSVSMNPDQEHVYKELCKELEAEYKGMELTALNSLTLVMRLAQVTSGFFPFGEDGDVASIGEKNPKIEALLTRAEEFEETPALVICRFVAEAKLAQAALKKKFPDAVVEMIVGETGSLERADILDRFKKGEVEYLVATPRTIGVGMNLQMASVVYFLSNSYSFIDRAQTEDRIHRPGTVATKCTYVDFLCRGTIDERVYEVLLAKKDLLDYIRGKSFAEFVGMLK